MLLAQWCSYNRVAMRNLLWFPGDTQTLLTEICVLYLRPLNENRVTRIHMFLCLH